MLGWDCNYIRGPQRHKHRQTRLSRSNVWCALFRIVLKQYEKEHTKRWSEIVESADAYVFVAPEYNYSPTPALVNALNYVYREWNYKPRSEERRGGIE